jgi:hypothetical protein
VVHATIVDLYGIDAVTAWLDPPPPPPAAPEYEWGEGPEAEAEMRTLMRLVG